eukprot:TRINITY_DN2917_c0_g1_i1.p1 TRINITY_DN2917_c0_g1~~TRINITY_DN2917_c0_g1_i1.p1  ORF type:complete len:861 (-),score=117.67 TRINITY_DN2917_c0_g1_i1:162-2744(-)
MLVPRFGSSRELLYDKRQAVIEFYMAKTLLGFAVVIIPLAIFSFYCEKTQSICHEVPRYDNWQNSTITDPSVYRHCILQPELRSMRLNRTDFPQEYLFSRLPGMIRFGHLTWHLCCSGIPLLWAIGNPPILLFTISQVSLLVFSATFEHEHQFYYFFQMLATVAALLITSPAFLSKKTFIPKGTVIIVGIYFLSGITALGLLYTLIRNEWVATQVRPSTATLSALTGFFALPVVILKQANPKWLLLSFSVLLSGAQIYLFQHTVAEQLVGFLHCAEIFRDLFVLWATVSYLSTNAKKVRMAVAVAIVAIASGLWYLIVSPLLLKSPPAFLLQDKYLYGLYSLIVVNNPAAPAPPNSSFVPVPKGCGELPKEQVSFGEWIPYVDHQDEHTTKDFVADFFFKDVLMEITKHPAFYPLQDLDRPWTSLDEARKAVANVTNNSKLLSDPNIRWTDIDVTSDEAVAHMSFGGVAAHHLVAVGSLAFETLPAHTKQAASTLNAAYVVDWTYMSAFEVRSGFDRFGAALFLLLDGAPAGILLGIPPNHTTYSLVLPGEKDWEYAKFAWRSTTVLGVTVSDHLTGVHLMAANLLSTASREHLPETHPIRRFLTPFTYHSIQVNYGVAQVLDELGMVHRAAALSSVGILKAMHYSFLTVDRYFNIATTLRDSGWQSSANPQLCSFAQDFLDYTQVVSKFAEKFVRIHYPTDADVSNNAELQAFAKHLPAHNRHPPPMDIKTIAQLRDLLTNFVVLVTAGHHLVGNVAEYLVDPRFATTKLRRGITVSDQQTTIQALLIVVLTDLQPKLINDWGFMFELEGPGWPASCKAMAEFQSDLLAFSDTVRERNLGRRFPTVAVDPRLMESSVAM